MSFLVGALVGANTKFPGIARFFGGCEKRGCFPIWIFQLKNSQVGKPKGIHRAKKTGRFPGPNAIESFSSGVTVPLHVSTVNPADLRPGLG